MRRICNVGRDFKPFIAPTGWHLLRKIRNPDAFFFLMGKKNPSGVGIQYKSTRNKFQDL